MAERGHAQTSETSPGRAPATAATPGYPPAFRKGNFSGTASHHRVKQAGPGPQPRRSEAKPFSTNAPRSVGLPKPPTKRPTLGFASTSYPQDVTNDKPPRSLALSSRTTLKRPKRADVEGVAIPIPRPGSRPDGHRDTPPGSELKLFHWGSKKRNTGASNPRDHRRRATRGVNDATDHRRVATSITTSDPARDASASATPQPKGGKYQNLKFSKTKVKVEEEVQEKEKDGNGGVVVQPSLRGVVQEEEGFKIPGLSIIRTSSPLTPIPGSRDPTLIPVPVQASTLATTSTAYAPGSAEDLRDIYGEGIEQAEPMPVEPTTRTKKKAETTKAATKGRRGEKTRVQDEVVTGNVKMLGEVDRNVEETEPVNADAGPSQAEGRKRKTKPDGPSQTKKRKTKGEMTEIKLELAEIVVGEVIQFGENPVGRRKVEEEEGEVKKIEKVKRGRKKAVEEAVPADEKGKEKATLRGRKRRGAIGVAEEGTDEPPKRKKRAKVEADADEPDFAYGYGYGDWGGRWPRKNTKSAVKWNVVGGSRAGNGVDQVKHPSTRRVGRPSKVKAAVPELAVLDANERDGGSPSKTLRPTIWTGSKSELLHVLPELSGSKCFNGVTEGSSNFPMVMLDESTVEGVGVEVVWSAQAEGKMDDSTLLKLTLTRDFICPARELVGEDNVPRNFDATSNILAPPSLLPPTAFEPSTDNRPQDDEGPVLEYIDEVLPTLHPDAKMEPGQAMIHSGYETENVLRGTSPALSALSYLSDSPTPFPIHNDSSALLEEITAPYSEFESMLDTLIPPTLPREVGILSSASNLSSPLILIASREVFNKHFWASASSPAQGMPEPIGLAEEHAYVFLEFFRVIRMDEKRAALQDGRLHLALGQGNVAGRVEWTFDVVWVPGYGRSKDLNSPWWSSSQVFGESQQGTTARDGNNQEQGPRDQFAWLKVQTQTRLDLLPMQLVDGQEEGSSDEAMPRGWLCKCCGRLNQKVMMRHRWCGSMSCRDEPLMRGYAVELDSTREPHQVPLALPINTCNPKVLDVLVADWDDGMRTFKYRPTLTDSGAGTGILKHVFTCNLIDLQREATPLFEKIQREVCLTKKAGDTGPMYTCQISDTYGKKKDKYAFSRLSWGEAPQAVKDAQDLMLFMGRSYGEDEGLTVDQLTIIGWVSSGSRKTPETLAAKGRTIAMLCLGNDVILTIMPKWETPAMPASVVVPQVSQVQMDAGVFLPQMVATASAPVPPNPTVLDQQANGTTMNADRVPDGMPHEVSDVDAVATAEHRVRHGRSISDAAGPDAPGGKSSFKSRQVSESIISVTLVHGDMLLFSGCDFEYSIKRMGTSLLLVGTKA